MIWVIVGSAAVGIAALTGWLATRRRRWMRRHPAPTFVFADLVGYTALTAARGDEAAAALAREFRRAMCALSRRHGAWQVKSMGDGVMIWAPDASDAMALAATSSSHRAATPRTSSTTSAASITAGSD